MTFTFPPEAWSGRASEVQFEGVEDISPFRMQTSVHESR